MAFSWSGFWNSLSRTWDRATPADGLLFQTEFSQLLANDVLAKSNIDDVKTSLTLVEDVAYSSITNGFADYSKTDVTFDESIRTFVLTPNATSYIIYSNSKKITISTSQNVVWNDTEGNKFLYFDDTGALISIDSFSIDLIEKYCYVSSFYWDATNKRILGNPINEFHGLMPVSVHSYVHFLENTRYENGAGITVNATGNGSADSHCQFAGASFAIRDEDIKHTGVSRVVTDTVVKIYRDSTAWREYKVSGNLTSFLVQTDPVTGRARYNSVVAGSGSQVTVDNNKFLLAHIFLVPGKVPSLATWWIFQGQNQYSTLNDARASARTEAISLFTTGLPIEEFVLAYTVIVQTSDSYSNSVKSRIVEVETGVGYIDWRGGSPTSVVSQSVDHNQTTNLNTGNYLHLTSSEYSSLTNAKFDNPICSILSIDVSLVGMPDISTINSWSSGTTYTSGQWVIGTDSSNITRYYKAIANPPIATPTTDTNYWNSYNTILPPIDSADNSIGYAWCNGQVISDINSPINGLTIQKRAGGSWVYDGSNYVYSWERKYTMPNATSSVLTSSLTGYVALSGGFAGANSSSDVWNVHLNNLGTAVELRSAAGAIPPSNGTIFFYYWSSTPTFVPVQNFMRYK